jgi:hypothetical protein
LPVASIVFVPLGTTRLRPICLFKKKRSFSLENNKKKANKVITYLIIPSSIKTSASVVTSSFTTRPPLINKRC